MKLASFFFEGTPSWGIVVDETIADVGATLRTAYPTLRSALNDDGLVRAAAVMQEAPRRALGSVTLRPVVPDCGKILCVGLNYEMHRRETGRQESQHPTIFTRFPDSLIAHGEDIVRPRVSGELDFEGELAVVIGRGGRRIRREDALGHVAGYTCHNDATLRDWQRHTTQFTPGKNFYGTGPLGPWLVTPDEVGDLATLTLETRLNGVVVQHTGIGQMLFPIPVLIEYISTFTPLSPGDVIATGTPGGVGSKRMPPLYMQPGDSVEVEIARVGLLRNGIVDES